MSTKEWMASDSIAELLLADAAMNLIPAMARLPTTAARTARFDLRSELSETSGIHHDNGRIGGKRTCRARRVQYNDFF